MNDSIGRFGNTLLSSDLRGLVASPSAGRQQLQFQQIQLAPQRRSIEEFTENASIRGQHPQTLQQFSGQQFRQVQSHRGSTHQSGYQSRGSLERHSSVERLQLNTVIPSSPSPRDNQQYQFPSSQLLRQLTTGNRLNGSIQLNVKASNVYQSQNNSQNSSLNGIINNNNNNISVSNGQQLLLAEDHSSKIASLGATFQAGVAVGSNASIAGTAGNGFFRTRTINTWDDSSNMTQFNRRNSTGINNQQYHILSPQHGNQQQQQQQYQLQDQLQSQIIQQQKQQWLFDSQVIQPNNIAPGQFCQRKGSLVIQQTTESTNTNGNGSQKQQLNSNNNLPNQLSMNLQSNIVNEQSNCSNNNLAKAPINCVSGIPSSSSVTNLYGSPLLRSQQSFHSSSKASDINNNNINSNTNLELKKTDSKQVQLNDQSKQCQQPLITEPNNTSNSSSNQTQMTRPNNNSNMNNQVLFWIHLNTFDISSMNDWSERKPRKAETTNEKHHGAWSSGKILDRQFELSLDTKQQTQQTLNILGVPSAAVTKTTSASSAALLIQQPSTNNIIVDQTVPPTVSSNNGEFNNNRQKSNSNQHSNIPISARGSSANQAKTNTMISGTAQNWHNSSNNTTTTSTPTTSSSSSTGIQLPQRIMFLERTLFETKQALASSLKYQQDLEKKMKMLIKQNEYLTGQEHPTSPRRQAAMQLQQGQILIDFEKKIEELVMENERINKAMMRMMAEQQQQQSEVAAVSANNTKTIVAENNKKTAQLSNKIQILQEREEKHKSRIKQLEGDKAQLMKKLKEYTVKDSVQSKDIEKNQNNCDDQKIEEITSGNQAILEKNLSLEGEVKENKFIEGFERRIGKLVEENERLNKLLALNCTQDQELRKTKKDYDELLHQRDYWKAKCMEMDKKEGEKGQNRKGSQRQETSNVTANNTGLKVVVPTNKGNSNKNTISNGIISDNNSQSRSSTEPSEQTSETLSSTSSSRSARVGQKSQGSSINLVGNLESKLNNVLIEDQKLNNILTEQINITQPRS